MNSDRNRRVSEQIKRQLSVLISRDVSDPRLGMVGVAAVVLSKDFKIATVYISVFKDEQAKDSIDALRSASGFLRTQLSQVINQRNTPKLIFKHDTSVTDAIAMSKLIDSVL